METDVRRFVDVEQGLIDRRIFIEPSIYEQELERIFARCWLFLCHDLCSRAFGHHRIFFLSLGSIDDQRG